MKWQEAWPSGVLQLRMVQLYLLTQAWCQKAPALRDPKAHWDFTSSINKFLNKIIHSKLWNIQLLMWGQRSEHLGPETESSSSAPGWPWWTRQGRCWSCWCRWRSTLDQKMVSSIAILTWMSPSTNFRIVERTARVSSTGSKVWGSHSSRANVDRA